MRVLQIINLGYEAGGAEKLVRATRDALQRHGHEVFILSTDKNSHGHEVFANAMVSMVTGSPPTRLVKYFWNPDAYRMVRRAIRDFDPDIVHLHTVGEFSPAALWAVGKRRAILTVHGPEEFTLKLLPWLLPASDYKHGSYRWDDIRPIGRLRHGYLRYLQRPAYRLALRRLRLVIAPSAFMAQVLAQDFPRTAITVLYSGTALPVDVAAPASGTPTVLYVGRLEAVKGVDDLLHAFALIAGDCPQSKLRIVGDGPEREALESLSTELGLSRVVEFAGWLPPAQLTCEYANSAVVAVPSVWPENFPLVVLEALAHGRPVVGTNTGGIPEIIQHGLTGAIVEPRDVRAFADAVSAFLFDRDKQVAAAKAAAARIREFSLEAFIARQLGVYRQVLNDHPDD